MDNTIKGLVSKHTQTNSTTHMKINWLMEIEREKKKRENEKELYLLVI